jgi:hypothetical protein
MERVAAWISVAAVLVLSGCAGSAVLISRTANGGVVGLDGEREQAMADARREMSEVCGGAYTIVAERTVTAGVFRGRTISEVQIRFACGAQPDRNGAPPVPR